MLMIWIFTLLTVSAQEVCSPQELNPLTWVQNLEDIGECIPLNEPGDVRVFNTTRGQKKNGYIQPNDTKFALKYLGGKSYEMVFNLKFIQTPKSEVSNEAMLKRVQNCLALASTGMVGPGGQKIAMYAVGDDGASTLNSEGVKPPPIQINIIESNNRGNANNYASDFNCATITHELMHYAGLCDEYRETGSDGGGSNAGECRALGAGDSLMSAGMQIAFDEAVGEVGKCVTPENSPFTKFLKSSNPIVRELIMRRRHYDIGNFNPIEVGLPAGSQSPKKQFCKLGDAVLVPAPKTVEDAFNSVESPSENVIEISSYEMPITDNLPADRKIFRRTLSCSCPSGSSSSCKEFLNLLRPQAFSIAERKVYRCPHFGSDAGPTDFSIPSGSFKQTGNVIEYRNERGQRPLLHPAHFARVLTGPCPTDNKQVNTYNHCARYSIKESQAELTCSQQAPECSNPQLWLGNL